MAVAEIGRSASRGVLITLVSRWGNTVLMLASSVVLARLLSPNDFGIVAMVAAITGLAVLFQDLGLTSAVIRAKYIDKHEQTTLLLLNIALGAVLTGSVFFGAGLIAAFYNEPEVAAVARAMSFTFVITALAGQARADLLRRLRFGVIAASEVTIGAVQFLVALLFALNGAGYWSLVAGTLVSTAIWTATLIVKARFVPARPAPVWQVMDLVTQGGQITLVQASTFLSRSLDVIAVGRFYGAETVGLYNRGSQVVGLVEQQLTAGLTSVALPVLSRLQDEPERFQRAVERAVRAIGYSLTPLFTTLSLAAVPAVSLVYGAQWTEAGHILVILALAGTVRSFFLLIELAATALGQMGRQISAALTSQILTAVALLGAATISIRAVAIAYVVTTFLSVAGSGWWIARGTTIEFGRTARTFLVPILTWATSYVVGALAKAQIDPDDIWIAAAVGVGAQLGAFAVIYVLVPAVRRDVADVLSIVTSAVGRRG